MVLPVARFDWNLAKKWLRWCSWLESRSPSRYELVIWVTPDLTRAQCAELLMAAKPINCRLERCSGLKELGYFGTPNQVLHGVLRFCEREYPGRAILWCEADTVPMQPRWVNAILTEYRACGRPFLGDVYREGPVPHSTGNAVYPPNWRQAAPMLESMGSEPRAFDSLCAHEILPRTHPAKTIQQIWRPALPMRSRALVRPSVALFHQCKDASLIDVLCEASGAPMIPLDPPLCQSTYATQHPGA